MRKVLKPAKKGSIPTKDIVKVVKKVKEQRLTDYQTFTTIDTPVEERRKMGVGDVWSNSAKCLSCGDEIRSKNRHDYVTCSCGNLSVDGGSWYGKMGVRDGWSSVQDTSVLYNNL